MLTLYRDAWNSWLSYTTRDTKSLVPDTVRMAWNTAAAAARRLQIADACSESAAAANNEWG